MPRWLVALAAAASATELVVMHKDGPKECDAAHKVRRGDNITMHYIGTIVRSFFEPFLEPALHPLLLTACRMILS
jgi:hypothetical protein